jgi:isopenicillin N synthase-like dioxygenase
VWKNVLEAGSGASAQDAGADCDAGTARPRWRPKVVCVEFNPTMPDDLVYIPPPNDAARHGASLSALAELGEGHGYALVETTLYNALFVRRDLFEASPGLRRLVPDTSVEALHDVTMGTSLYQLYDGTVKIHGCKKLLWHRVPLDEAKIQVLPSRQRRFPHAPPSPTPAPCPSPPRGRAIHRAESSTAPDGESDASDDDSSFDSSHVVDVSAWCRRDSDDESGDKREEQRRRCSRQLLGELRRCGFCHVRGTGVPRGLCRRALKVSGRFLHGADEGARRRCLARDRARRGYSPPGTENFGCLAGSATAPNDRVRKFRIGPPCVVRGDTALSPSSSLLQPNVWPDPDHWEDAAEFRSAVEAYYEAANRAAESVVRAIAAGLAEAHPELEESLSPLLGKERDDSFSSDEAKGNAGDLPGGGADADAEATAATAATTTSILTLLGYSPPRGRRGGKAKKERSEAPLVAAHTDVGVLTMLLFDAGPCAALQRWRRRHREPCAGAATSPSAEGWVDVRLPRVVPPDPVFVINVADCLSELSGGHLPSTLHRVVANRTPPSSISNRGSRPGPGGGGSNARAGARTCCALFVGLRPDAPVRLRGESLSYEQWRKRRIERAAAVLKQAAAAAAARSEPGELSSPQSA